MKRIPHSRPSLPSPEEWAEVTGRLAAGWIADGPCGDAFARQAAGWLGTARNERKGGGVAVNSGTSALHLALLAVDVRPGSEVLLPAYCCAALLNAVALSGAVPVLVDSEPDGFNLCTGEARRRLTGRTAAVVVAHMFGRPAPIDPFLDLGVPVIEDCAQSLGAREGGQLTGSRGAVSFSSFYATKVITTGQGGLVATREPERLQRLRDLVEYDNREEWQPRFSYRMSELQAALGLWQLERLPAFLERRRCLAAYYDECFSAIGAGERDRGAICYRYVVRVPDAEAAIEALQARGVDAKRPVYRPLHHYLGGDYPHAQAAHEHLVSLPLYPALNDGEAESVVAAVRAAALPIRRC
jgi:dTDP-4-amino-4,6-dideoxygalactose transaminase